MGKDIERLKVGDTDGIGQCYLQLKSQNFEYLLFRSVKHGPPCIICAGRNIVVFGVFILQVLGVVERRRNGVKVSIDVYDASRGFDEGGQLCGEE